MYLFKTGLIPEIRIRYHHTFEIPAEFGYQIHLVGQVFSDVANVHVIVVVHHQQVVKFVKVGCLNLSGPVGQYYALLFSGFPGSGIRQFTLMPVSGATGINGIVCGKTGGMYMPSEQFFSQRTAADIAETNKQDFHLELKIRIPAQLPCCENTDLYSGGKTTVCLRIYMVPISVLIPLEPLHLEELAQELKNSN